jgi:hypothetical protein
MGDTSEQSGQLERLREVLKHARYLAGSENLMLRVAGERIAVIITDVLYEVDVDIADPIALLPPMLRDA